MKLLILFYLNFLSMILFLFRHEVVDLILSRYFIDTTQVPLDSQYVACDNCGRQEFDNKKQNGIHSVDDCYLKHPLVKWKVSASEKALVPPCMFVPFSLLKDGSQRDLPNRGNLTCNDCIYLVSLRNNFLKSSTNGNFLSLTLISVRLPSQETVKLDQRGINIKGLLDSGSLAGDFISQETVENFDLNSYVTLDKSSKRVCSGLDNSCTLSIGSLNASFVFTND